MQRGKRPSEPTGETGHALRAGEERDPREQMEISQAIQEIVDPSLSCSTDRVDPGSGISEGAKAKVAAYRAHVGRVIRDRRNALKMTQEQLAEKSGLHQSHVSRIEAGEHTPTHTTIEKLAAALDTEPGQLDLLYAD